MSANPKIARIPTIDFTSPKLYNAAYLDLFQNKSRFLHLFGSAGSGKSAFGFQKEIVRSYRPSRRNRKTMVVRQTYNTLKDSCYSDLKSIIYDWNLENDFDILKSPLSITNKKSNVEFIFRGLDDVEKIKSVKGVDRIIVEEATEVKKRGDLDQLSLRLRGFDEVQITLMYNPVDEHHWLNTEFHQMMPPGHYIRKTTYKDNRFLDAAYKNFLESLKDANPNYYRVYVEGKWGTVVEGLIYPEFEIIPEFPKDANGEDDIHSYGLDFGFSDPTCLIANHIQDALPKKKLINKQLIYKSGLDAIGLIAEFNRIGVRKDILIVADSARPEMIASLKNEGYKVEPSEKFAGSVLSGINKVRGYTLGIVAGSKELIKEAQNYTKNQVHGVWVEEPKKNQVDHGCFIAGTKISTDLGEKPIEEIKVGDYVLTRAGYKKVLVSAETARNADVITATFSNGVALTGTANHPVFVKSKGFVNMDTIRYNDEVLTSEEIWKSLDLATRKKHKELDSTELFTGATRTAKILPTVFISKTIADICTAMFGSFSTAKSPKAFTSTIRTKIPTITTFPIWNAFRPLTITKNTKQSLSSGSHLTSKKSTYQSLKNLLANGIHLKKVKNGIALTAKRRWQSVSRLKKNAITAVQNIKHRLFQQQSVFVQTNVNLRGAENPVLMMLLGSVIFAEPNLKQINTTKSCDVQENAPQSQGIKVVGIKKESTKQNVYNLTVGEMPEYFANGILVHNCDAIRYGEQAANQPVFEQPPKIYGTETDFEF